jgi:hypothetical protein
MDVRNMISKLRSEWEDIDQAIRFLEHGNVNLGARAHRNCHPLRGGLHRRIRVTETAGQSVIELRRDGGAARRFVIFDRA